MAEKQSTYEVGIVPLQEYGVSHGPGKYPHIVNETVDKTIDILLENNKSKKKKISVRVLDVR